MKQVYISGEKNKGKYCLVDDDDYELVSRYRWYVNHKGYAMCNIPRSEYEQWNRCGVPMHRMIMGFNQPLMIDHVDCNKLNNQKSNLRFVTNLQNVRHRGCDKRSVTGYKGVYLYRSKTLAPTTIRYCSYIRVNGKLLFVGYFKSSQEAALAYNEASRKHHGVFGWQNQVTT